VAPHLLETPKDSRAYLLLQEQSANLAPFKGLGVNQYLSALVEWALGKILGSESSKQA
jgi:hypothetical protein